MKKTILLFFILLLLFHAFSLFALDFGVLLDQTLGVESVDGSSAADGLGYSGTLISWLSTPLDSLQKGTRLYLSVGLTQEYSDKNASFVPELLRTEFAFPINEGMEIKAGRIQYADPLGLVAVGLFDGARFTLASEKLGTFGVGVWYTGLLYKKNARITMTEKELESYGEKLDLKNFADTYFAPARVLYAVDWDNPFLTQWLRLKAAHVGQFDLSGDEKFNSQYLTVKAAIPISDFVFDLGGCFEFAQASDKTMFSLLGELCVSWMLPTPINDRLALTGRISTGSLDDGAFAAFVPVTTVEQGYVLKANISGLSTICLDYTARLNETLSFDVSSTYFLLNDPVTYKGPPHGRGGPALGNEFYGRLIWAPFSDLRLNLGGGAFLPSLGKADKDAKPIWRVELNAVMVFL